MKWFTIDYWRYLFSSTRCGKYERPTVSIIWCRIKGHPNGVIYFTGPTANEPDMHCVDCGDDLG